MSQDETPRSGSLQQKLDQAFRQAGVSHRQLARLALGPKATEKRLKNLRTQISKWRNTPGVGISAPNSALLAKGFSKAGLILPTDYFLAEPDSGRSGLDDLLRRIEELERKVG